MLTESALSRARQRHEMKRAERRRGMRIYKLQSTPDVLFNDATNRPEPKVVLSIKVKGRPAPTGAIGKIGRWASRLLGGGR